MERKVIEVKFWDSGAVLFLLARNLGGLSYAEFRVAEEEKLNQDGVFISTGLYQDDGFTVRIVLGDLTAQEENDWVARSQGKLNLLNDGELMIGSAYDWMGYDSWDTEFYPRMLEGQHGGKYETITFLKFPPNLYQVNIYNYLPNDLSDAIDTIRAKTHNGSKDEFLKNYFEVSHPNEPLPEWIEDDLESNCIDFLVHLTPTNQQDYKSLPILNNEMNFGWEYRLPEKCPFELPTDTVFTEMESYSDD